MDYAPMLVSDLDAARIAEWRDAGFVFLTGSLVSTFAPTNLPTGTATTRALWEKILGARDRDFFKKGCEEWAVLKDFPFEAIMHCYPDGAGIKQIIQTMFREDKFNKVHELLASTLRSGVIEGLITTNYDLAFETALGGAPNVITVFDKESSDNYWACQVPGANKVRPFLKIHGTAALADTIQCDLNSERRLCSWKRTLLAEMVRDRTLVVIGYSGSDFDICPELAYATRQKRTVWLVHQGGPKLNAKRVLQNGVGLVVKGDLCPFLERVLGGAVSPLPAKECSVDLSGFDPSLTPEWRLRILNWIGCPKLLCDSADEILQQDAEFRRAFFDYQGKYREAIRALESAPSAPELSNEAFLHDLRVIIARLVYGQHVKPLIKLIHLNRMMDRTTYVSQNVRTLAIEAKLVLYTRIVQFARFCQVAPVERRIQKLAMPLYQKARESLESLGEWPRLEILQHNAERLGVSKADVMAMASHEGYWSLGMHFMHSMTIRDAILDDSGDLTPENTASVRDNLEIAEKFGWHHEAWKLSWILLWREKGRKRQNFEKWRNHFWETEYAFLFRFVRLFTALGPLRGRERIP